MKTLIRTTEKTLTFEPWELGDAIALVMGMPNKCLEFFYGTCKGLCSTEGNSFLVIAIINNNIGNGDFPLTMDALEAHAKSIGKNRIEVRDILNTRLYEWLLSKGYVDTTERGERKVEKVLNDE